MILRTQPRDIAQFRTFLARLQSPAELGEGMGDAPAGTGFVPVAEGVCRIFQLLPLRRPPRWPVLAKPSSRTPRSRKLSQSLTLLL